MPPDQTAFAMKRTPQQTYLAERLNSAAGLGWQMSQTESTWHGLSRFIAVAWARIASLTLPRRPHATR
jgi:hypothetical protein